jgi:hypothetical protein
LLLAAWLAPAGCGSADRTKQERPEEPDSQAVNVEQTINICPQFVGSIVLPQTIPPGETAVVGVHATDPDGDDALLTYEWTATSGTFSDPEQAATHYDCDATGAQILTVVTKDARGCHVQLDIAVTCLAR